jgi:PAS domain S-box-containing protein
MTESETGVKLDMLFDNLAEGIIILDNKFNIKRANNSFMNIFGFSRNELIGFNIKDILISLDKNEDLQTNLNILSSGREVNFKIHSKRKSGDEIHLDIKAFSINLEEKEAKYYLICSDITEFENIKRDYEKIKVKYNLIFENDNVFE